MRKLLLLLIVLLSCQSFCVASQSQAGNTSRLSGDTYTSSGSFGIYSVKVKSRNGDVYYREPYAEKVRTIGNNILKKNHIKERIAFNIKYFSIADNAFASSDNGDVYVNRGLFKTVENDDELAAVLSHEIAHVLNNDAFKQRLERIVLDPIILIPDACVNAVTLDEVHLMKNVNKSIEEPYENRADLKGVDLMVGAGYNPVAMVSAYEKFMGDGHAVFRTHASGTKRINNISRYINTKYPQYVKDLDTLKAQDL